MAYDTFPTLGIGKYGPLGPGSGVQPMPRLLVANFGDGYAQRTADGINALPLQFNYKSVPLTADRLILLDGFLKQRGGYIPFLFTVPNEGILRQFTCKVWSLDYAYPLHSIFNATFEENFDP